MCSIAGLYSNKRDGFELMSIMDTMLEMTSSRGPDFSDIATCDSDVIFGHNRLAILDLTHHSNQPIYTEDQSMCMVFNGEAFNFRDFGNYASDTLMLVDQIEKHGFNIELLRRINGMFSLAVFDSVERKIFAAVDAFAQKPCYYFQDGKQFALASTPAALTILKDKWELDQFALASMFTLGSVIGDRSLFEGIKKLPGGHMLTYSIDTGNIHIEKWFEFNPEPVTDIVELVFDAIDQVKVSDVPVSIYCSGGIDSTLVATRFQGHNAIHLQSPEVEFAQLVAEKENLNLTICPITLDRESVFAEYVKTGDSAMSCIQPYIVSHQAKKFGKVAIIANGADEVFYGYPRTHSTEQRRHIFRSGYQQYWNEWISTQNQPAFSNSILERITELRSFVECDLNKTLDFASMCHSVEVRSPFLDHRLVNAALGLHYNSHYSAKYHGKTILKEALVKLGYSDKFVTRSKHGFSLPNDFHLENKAALEWCISNGFLKRRNDWNGRDLIYISATAACFYQWWKTWSHKLK